MDINVILGFFIVLVAIIIALFSRPLNLNKTFYIKLFFVLFMISISCAIISYLIPLTFLTLIGSLFMWFAFALVLLHSSKVLGNKNTIIFFIIALLFGLFSEALSVIFGLYHYTIHPFFFGLVPLTTPIAWAIIIYFSYSITNLLLFGFGGEKPKKTDNLWYFVGLITLLSFIGGLIAVNLDMILDPVAISPQIGGWIYNVSGPYFGVPISNFIGWFLVSAIAIFLFRCYEAISSNSNTYPELDINLNLYIILIYLMYFLENAVKAFKIGKIEYILIGATTMMPFILIAILGLMLNMKKNQ
jgi:uncharacterized membrane protein